MNKNTIKKIMFYSPFLDTDQNKTLLFKPNVWYKVEFVTPDEDQIQVIAETGEKIGFSMNDNPNLFCVRR
jgi:hypothetical protein